MEMSKTEQKRLLTKFKKYLKKAGLGNRMRLDDTADFDYVELQIAKKDGDYNDSYIVVFNRDGLGNRFCYNEYTTIIDNPTEEEIVSWLKANNDLKAK